MFVSPLGKKEYDRFTNSIEMQRSGWQTILNNFKNIGTNNLLGLASDLAFNFIFALFPLILLMVWMGTFTQSFIPSISASNAVLLAPIDARHDIHVRKEPPRGTNAGPQKELADAR